MPCPCILPSLTSSPFTSPLPTAPLPTSPHLHSDFASNISIRRRDDINPPPPLALPSPPQPSRAPSRIAPLDGHDTGSVWAWLGSWCARSAAPTQAEYVLRVPSYPPHYQRNPRGTKQWYRPLLPRRRCPTLTYLHAPALRCAVLTSGLEQPSLAPDPANTLCSNRRPLPSLSGHLQASSSSRRAPDTRSLANPPQARRCTNKYDGRISRCPIP